MKDQNKRQGQLVNELAKLRQRVVELEALAARAHQLEAEVAERKQVEHSLREHVEYYHSMLDNMLEGIQIIGFDWRYLYLNDTAARYGSQAKEELLGYTVMERYPGFETTAMYSLLRRCLEERTAAVGEVAFTYPDGKIGWFAFSVHPVPAVPEGIFILSLDVSAQHQGTIHLLLSDVMMPGMGGPEVLKELKSSRPAVKVLYISGYSAQIVEHRGVLQPGTAFLQKPFKAEDLLLKVREALEITPPVEG